VQALAVGPERDGLAGAGERERRRVEFKKMSAKQLRLQIAFRPI
jgi:hypothetical protein